MASDVDPDANLAVVVDRNKNAATIIDLSNNSTKATVTVGTTPTSVAVNPRTHQAVVTNFDSDDISIIDLTLQQVIATVEVGSSPRDVAIDTDNNVAIVVNLNDNSVSLIDLRTAGELLSTPIPVGTFPIAVAYNPSNHTALVANYQDGTVSVIDLTNKVRLTNINVGTNPVDIAVGYDINRAVVANQGSGNATVLNLTDNSVVATVTVGGTPFGVGINPRTKLAAVLDNSTKSISMIYLGNGYDDDLNIDPDPYRNTKVTTVIANAGDNPIHLAINPSNNTALLSNLTSDSLTIVPLSFYNFLPFANDTATERSNLVINNLGFLDSNVQIELRDTSGTLLATGSALVPAYGFKQISNINQVLYGTNTPTNTQGMLKLTSEQPVTSMISLIDNNSNDPGLVPGRGTGYSRLFVNSVANLSLGAGFTSELMILNLGTTTASLTLTARDQVGGVLATKPGVTIAINGFYYSQNIFADLGIIGQVGSLEINSATLSPLSAVTRVDTTSHTSGLLEAVPIQ